MKTNHLQYTIQVRITFIINIFKITTTIIYLMIVIFNDMYFDVQYRDYGNQKFSKNPDQMLKISKTVISFQKNDYIKSAKVVSLEGIKIKDKDSWWYPICEDNKVNSSHLLPVVSKFKIDIIKTMLNSNADNLKL